MEQQLPGIPAVGPAASWSALIVPPYVSHSSAVIDKDFHNIRRGKKSFGVSFHWVLTWKSSSVHHTWTRCVSLSPRMPSNLNMAIKEVVMEKPLRIAADAYQTIQRNACESQYSFFVEKLSWRHSCGHVSVVVMLLLLVQLNLLLNSRRSVCLSVRPSVCPSLTWRWIFDLFFLLSPI